MHTIKFIYWKEDGAWIGSLQDYSNAWTQGKTLDDLKEHLKDLYHDLTSGQLPGICSCILRTDRFGGETYES
jgi:hypothetical protein